MSAYNELSKRIKETEVMQQVLADLEKEPASILFYICRQYEPTNEPVPDHRIHLSGYLGDVALQSLLAAALLEREGGRRLSIYQYKPTAKGMEYYRKLVEEGWSPERPREKKPA